MTSLSIIECCQLLAVDPKTLRQWLAQAQMPLHAHPTDARIKCLTNEQVFVLANLHDRVLQTAVPAAFAGPTPSELESQTPLPSTAEADVRTRLAQLEARVSMLQTQLTDLALQLLKERQAPPEQPVLATPAHQRQTDEQACAAALPSVLRQPAIPSLVCYPTEKPNRLVPLIEYGAKGRYLLISPEEGELPITPDSPEWFAWLASLSSFRFVGKFGRFSARRGYNRRQNRCWYAQRTIHQQFHGKYIGVSEHITIERLEQIATYFQSYLLQER